MKKVGLIMRKIQFGEAQGPRVWAERLRKISRELGVEIVFISPERHVSDREVLPGYEFEKSDLVNYDIVLDKIRSEKIEHVIYTVAGFSFLKLFLPNCVLFPHSFPDPELANSEMIIPFYQMVDKAIVQTEFLKERIATFGVSDTKVIPIGFEDELAVQYFDPIQVVPNRVLWMGRDESNRRPDLVVEYAHQNPQAEVYMVFGGLRYQETMKRFNIPSNLHLRFGLSRQEVFELMNTAKVYWNCSRFDTFAMPLAEALSMGKFIVKPEHPCYRHISSRHVYAGNEENWFDLINMGLANTSPVSNANREYAFDHFSTKKMKEGFSDFFTKWLD